MIIKLPHSYLFFLRWQSFETTLLLIKINKYDKRYTWWNTPFVENENKILKRKY